MKRSYKLYVFSLFILVVLILGLYFEQLAQAIPAGQRDCDTNVVQRFDTTKQIVTGSSVTVNNGDVSRNCIIQFSTEAFASPGDLILIQYTIDSTNPANCIIIGPELFHQGEDFNDNPETKTHMGVRTIGPGMHTIRPCFQGLDQFVDGQRNYFFADRCLTVECRTQ